MQTTNSKTIEIKGMTGDDCVQKVTGALKGVAGVETQSVKVGTADITCDDPTRLEAACAAVRNVGFKAFELAGDRAAVGANSAETPASGTTAKQEASMTTDRTAGAIGAPSTRATPIPSGGVSTISHSGSAPATTPAVPAALTPA